MFAKSRRRVVLTHLWPFGCTGSCEAIISGWEAQALTDAGRYKLYVCLQRADDELCFHISGPSSAQVLAKLSSQGGRLKPLQTLVGINYMCVCKEQTTSCASTSLALRLHRFLRSYHVRVGGSSPYRRWSTPLIKK